MSKEDRSEIVVREEWKCTFRVTMGGKLIAELASAQKAQILADRLAEALAKKRASENTAG